MSDKTSQRTEEEMLDQTFVGYDEEMTVQTEDSGKETSAPANPPAKKKNQNLLVYGAMGVAAVGFLGFKFLGGSSHPQQPQAEPMQAQQQAPAPAPAPVVQQAASTPAAVTTEPVAVPASSPVATQPQTVVTPPVVQPDAQSASAPVDPVAQYTGNTNTASLPKIDVQPKVDVKPDVKPSVKPDVQPAVTTDNKTVNVDKVAAVTASNAEASSNNDKLLAQFQEMLDKKYDPKFEQIQKSLDEQKDFNKSIEERLARLEAGKATKVSSKSSNDYSEGNNNETKPVKKIVRKPVIIRHKVKAIVPNKSSKVDDGDVLIDKSSIKTKPEIQRIMPVYPKVEIHSIYSGRVWTKNSDGTLSTFAVGDRLPTGEVIKKIDEDKETITTDKRVISE